MIKAAAKPRLLRSSVNFFPSSFISMGAVITPTMTRVVMNADIVMTVAPERRSEPARGNATNEGIKVTAPITAARIVAENPASAPTNPEIVSGVKSPKVNPTIPSTLNKLGAVLRSALPAIFKGFLCFILTFYYRSDQAYSQQSIDRNDRDHLNPPYSRVLI